MDHASLALGNLAVANRAVDGIEHAFAARADDALPGLAHGRIAPGEPRFFT
jgi:hypothetical protein